MAPQPRNVYAERLAERRAEIARREELHRRMGYGQLAVVAGAGLLVWIALAGDSVSILWVLAPAAIFGALVVIHENLLKTLERRRRAARYFEKGQARLDGNWPGTGETGE